MDFKIILFMLYQENQIYKDKENTFVIGKQLKVRD